MLPQPTFLLLLLPKLKGFLDPPFQNMPVSVLNASHLSRVELKAGHHHVYNTETGVILELT